MPLIKGAGKSQLYEKNWNLLRWKTNICFTIGQVSMNIDVTETTSIRARDNASDLANKVLGNLSAVRVLQS